MDMRYLTISEKKNGTILQGWKNGQCRFESEIGALAISFIQLEKKDFGFISKSILNSWKNEFEKYFQDQFPDFPNANLSEKQQLEFDEQYFDFFNDKIFCFTNKRNKYLHTYLTFTEFKFSPDINNLNSYDLNNEFQHSLKAKVDFIRSLQNKMTKVLEFCFDQSYSKMLNDYTPIERFYIGTALKQFDFPFDKFGVDTTSDIRIGRYIILNSTDKYKLMADYESKEELWLIDDLEKMFSKYDLDPLVGRDIRDFKLTETEIFCNAFRDLRVRHQFVYEVNSLEDFAVFEMLHMIFHNLSVKRCAEDGCNAFFISKRINSEYCEKHRKKGAQDKHKVKIKRNLLINEYSEANKKLDSRISDNYDRKNMNMVNYYTSKKEELDELMRNVSKEEKAEIDGISDINLISNNKIVAAILKIRELTKRAPRQYII